MPEDTQDQEAPAVRAVQIQQVLGVLLHRTVVVRVEAAREIETLYQM